MNWILISILFGAIVLILKNLANKVDNHINLLVDKALDESTEYKAEYLGLNVWSISPCPINYQLFSMLSNIEMIIKDDKSLIIKLQRGGLDISDILSILNSTKNISQNSTFVSWLIINDVLLLGYRQKENKQQE